MTVIPRLTGYEYVAVSGDWRLLVDTGTFSILPQVGAWSYTSGTNLDNLARLIDQAKAHALRNGINWSGN